METTAKRRIWLTDEQKQTAAHRYNIGESPDSIAESFGVCANNVRNAIRNLNIPMRNRSEARTKLYHWKEAFDKPVTSDSGYWVGFICGDGSVFRAGAGSKILEVTLAERDRAHLEMLKKYTRSDHKIGFRMTKDVKFSERKVDPYPQARFSIRSSYLTAALERLGIRNKSLERVAPACLVNSRDFWRGLIDSDGYISVSVNNKPRLGLCGGKELMYQFLDFIDQHVGHNLSVRQQGKIHRTDMTSGTALAIIELLYGDAGTALARKLRIASAIIQNDMEEAKRQMVIAKSPVIDWWWDE